jgi:CPA2 family monovalent cation:H+ antiporter-2
MKLEEALSTSMQGDWEAPKPEDVPVWMPTGKDTKPEPKNSAD